MKKVENERNSDGERGREKEKREATRRTERREGRLWPTSHLSCVTTPCSYNTYIHIQDRSSISHTHSAQKQTISSNAPEGYIN